MVGVTRFLREVKMKVEYDDRIVLFFDIIGFKKIVGDRDCQEIFDILDKIQEESFNQNAKDILVSCGEDGMYDIDFESGDLKVGKIMGNEVSYTFFSDSVVVSIDPKGFSSIHYIFQFCANLQFTLLQNGIMIRGGLSYGKIFHKNNVVYGQALIDAYEVEDKKIVFPFIGVDEDFFNQVAEAKNFQDDYFELQSVISEKDGQHYEVYRFNFLSLFPQDHYSNDITRPELMKILDFLKKNNDDKKTPRLIEYVEDFVNRNSLPVVPVIKNQKDL